MIFPNILYIKPKHKKKVQNKTQTPGLNLETCSHPCIEMRVSRGDPAVCAGMPVVCSL